MRGLSPSGPHWRGECFSPNTAHSVEVPPLISTFCDASSTVSGLLSAASNHGRDQQQLGPNLRLRGMTDGDVGPMGTAAKVDIRLTLA